MKKLLSSLAALGIVVATMLPANATSTTVAQNFTVNYPGGTSTALTITNQPYCMVQVNLPQGQFSITPEFSTDGTTYTAAQNFSIIGQAGVYIAATDSGSDTNFRVNVHRAPAGSITGQIVCGDQANLPPATNGGGGGGGGINTATAPLLISGTTISDLALPKNLVTNLGAVCDGSTDDKTIINAATFPVQVPLTNCFASEAFTSLPDGLFDSSSRGNINGHLITRESAANNNRAAIFAAILTNPAFTGTAFNFTTGWNGDFSHVPYQSQIYINPASGNIPAVNGTSYVISPNTSNYVSINNYGANAGFQGYTTGTRNGSRSMLPSMILKTDTQAQGDNPLIYCSVLVHSVLPTSAPTFWGGDAAGACTASQITGATDGMYLHPGGDQNCDDNAHDDECVGVAYNMNRQNATAALNESWEAVRVQGTQSDGVQIESAMTVTANVKYGLDFTAANAGSPVPAIPVAARAGDQIQLNCTNTHANGNWTANTTCPDTGIVYNSSTTNIEIHNAGHVFSFPSASPAAALIGSTGATSTAAPNATWGPFPCGTGAVGCSSGVVTVTSGYNPVASHNWLGTMTLSMSLNSAATAQSILGCVTSTSTFTAIDATQGNQAGTGGGNSNIYCKVSPATAIMGIPNFGNNTAGLVGINETAVGHFCIASNTSFVATPYVKESSTGADVVASFLSVVLVPGGC